MYNMSPEINPISLDLARTLVAEQFPQWAQLPLTPVASVGTDNALFRLGNDMMVRLPKAAWAHHLVARENTILPHLAGRLPLAIPQIVAAGQPSRTFPHPWSILCWIDGESGAVGALDIVETATALARFVRTLQGIEPAHDLPAGHENGYRGASLRTRDKPAREAIAALTGEIDAAAAMRLWERALAAPAHHGPGTWVHGDLHPGNVLTQNGRLAAVIDWGVAAIGDPAIDLMPTWSMFTGDARATFRKDIGADATAWLRASGWTLSVCVIALAYYRGKNAAIVAATRREITEVLGEI